MHDEYKDPANSECFNKLITKIKAMNSEEQQQAIVQEIERRFHTFFDDLLDNFDFIYNICQSNYAVSLDAVKELNFANLIIEALQNQCTDINQLSQGMLALAQYCLRYTDTITPEIMIFATSTFSSIENISPDNIQLARSNILLVCSILNTNTIEQLDPNFPFILDKIFLRPEIISLSKNIIHFADLMIKVACPILMDENNEIYSPLSHEIAADGVQFVLSLVSCSNEPEEFPPIPRENLYLEERSFLLYSLFEHRLTSFEDEDTVSAFLNVLTFGDEFVKYALKIIAISENFEFFDPKLISISRGNLKFSNSPDSAELRLISIQLFEKFIKVDSQAFANSILCFDTHELFDDFIAIIMIGSSKEVAKIGNLIASIMNFFPGIFHPLDLWVPHGDSAGFANAYLKLLEVIDIIPDNQELIVGLKFVYNYIQNHNYGHTADFVSILSESGIQSELEDMDCDFDDIVQQVYHEIFENE